MIDRIPYHRYGVTRYLGQEDAVALNGYNLLSLSSLDWSENLFLRMLPRSTKAAMPSTTNEPLSNLELVLRLEEPCEGAPERSELRWDRTLLLSLVQTLDNGLETYPRGSLSLSSRTFARKPKSLGSTIFFFIYISPLVSVIFMIKETMLISSFKSFWTRNPTLERYELERSELK